MSKVVWSVIGGRRVVVKRTSGPDVDGVYLGILHSVAGVGMAGELRVPRGAFLAALASELDAIVIERSELPEVLIQGDWREAGAVSGHYRATSDEHRRVALGHLAIAEHLAANPPVDEALVEQIRDLALQADVTLSGTQVDTIARYFAGRVQVTP